MNTLPAHFPSDTQVCPSQFNQCPSPRAVPGSSRAGRAGSAPAAPAHPCTEPQPQAPHEHLLLSGFPPQPWKEVQGCPTDRWKGPAGPEPLVAPRTFARAPPCPAVLQRLGYLKAEKQQQREQGSAPGMAASWCTAGHSSAQSHLEAQALKATKLKFLTERLAEVSAAAWQTCKRKNKWFPDLWQSFVTSSHTSEQKEKKIIIFEIFFCLCRCC